ncbi:hypothetical protein E2C01_026933 [Portunus trituberculatus]|uniref:Uncharacterized protein n=1 Tax=Portunus trituberculatus TaxID=210409 RepID=A0A5B7EJS5_PORTR|nr:hypothetical protein [Portunus trituberculatus]
MRTGWKTNRVLISHSLVVVLASTNTITKNKNSSSNARANEMEKARLILCLCYFLCLGGGAARAGRVQPITVVLQPDLPITARKRKVWWATKGGSPGLPSQQFIA